MRPLTAEEEATLRAIADERFASATELAAALTGVLSCRVRRPA